MWILGDGSTYLNMILWQHDTIAGVTFIAVILPVYARTIFDHFNIFADFLPSNALPLEQEISFSSAMPIDEKLGRIRPCWTLWWAVLDGPDGLPSLDSHFCPDKPLRFFSNVIV